MSSPIPGIWYVCFSQLTAMHGMSVFLISLQHMVCLSFSPHCNMSVFLSSPQCIVCLFLSSFQHPESQTNHWQGTSGRGPPDCRADLRTLLTPGCCAPGIHLIELSSTPPPPPPPTNPSCRLLNRLASEYFCYLNNLDVLGSGVESNEEKVFREEGGCQVWPSLERRGMSSLTQLREARDVKFDPA